MGCLEAKDAFARHDLVSIAPYVRRSMEVEVIGAEGFWPEDEVNRLVRDGYNGVFVPGIVARQPEGVNGLVVGLSAPYRKEDMRLRAFATIDLSDVVAVRNPYQVAALLSGTEVPDYPVFSVAREVVAAAAEAGLECGLFGSCALELVTGLPYCHATSDLDAVVGLASKEVLDGFYRTVLALQEEAGISVDVEVQLPGGWGVKLKELCETEGTVLAKGFSDVRLFEVDKVFAMDHRFSFERKEKQNGSQV